jgi:hypothetical protein
MIVLIVGFCLVVAAAALLVLADFDELWDIPSGTPVRPMLLVLIIFLGGAASALLAFGLALFAVIIGRRWKRIWVLALLLFLLGFSPFVVADGVYIWIIDFHHLEPEP